MGKMINVFYDLYTMIKKLYKEGYRYRMGEKYMNYKNLIIEAVEKVKDEKILKKIYYFVIKILD